MSVYARRRGVYCCILPEMYTLVRMSAVSNHRLNIPGSDLVTSGNVVVSCIYAHVGWQMSKPLFDVIQKIRYRVCIANVGGWDTNVDNEVVLTVYRAVFTVVASGGFSVEPKPQNHLYEKL